MTSFTIITSYTIISFVWLENFFMARQLCMAHIGLCTVHGPGAPGAPRAPKTLTLRVMGAPGAPEPQEPREPHLLHDLQTDVDRSKVKEQLTNFY